MIASKEVNEYLANPDSSKINYMEVRIDFESIKLEKNAEILDILKIDFQKLKQDEDIFEEYYSYEDKRFIYIKETELIIAKVKDILIAISLNEEAIKELHKKIEGSELKKYIVLSEIQELKNSPLSMLLYPFLLDKFISDKNNYTIEVYDKLILSLNAFKNALKENNQLYYYMSFILLSSLLEELFLYIAKKENISLDKTYSISDCIDHLEGKMSLKVKHPDSVKESNGEKQLVVLSEQNNANKIFTKKDKIIGKRIISLLNEIKDIRTKYVHFVSQKPNNPSDNLIGIINLGQFLIWCENNGYL